MIPANDFRALWNEISSDALAAVNRVGEAAWYILGAEDAAFEQALAAAWGLPHAVGVASGLDAIEIALRALGCGPGCKVLTTPLSAFATTLAILRTGATPVFADCDDHGLVRLDLAVDALRRDPSIRYFVPVHLYGFPLDPGALMDSRDRFELRIVEDCAQSILATRDGRPTGAVGQMAATSFYPTKNLGAMGDGGALLCADAELAAQARALRDYGQTAKYRHTVRGLNSRLDEVQAAILRDAMLPRLERWTARRRAIGAYYDNGIRNSHIRVPIPAGVPSRHLYPVFVDPALKGDFLAHLKGRGIGAAEHYPLTIPEQEAMRGVPFEMATPCENAVKIARSQVSLPIHPFLTDAEMREVADACNSWRATL